MRSRAARLAFTAVAWIACGAAAFFVAQSEQQSARRRAASREFDLHAREAVDVLWDLRAAQQAYVAEGQGAAFWIPKVASLRASAASAVEALRGPGTPADASKALSEAAASLDDFTAADSRAREYISAEQPLMAADVVFTEGTVAATAAARRVEAARLADRQALDAVEAGSRTLEAYAIGGAAGLSMLFLLVLGVAPAGPRRGDVPTAGVDDAGLDLSLATPLSQARTESQEAPSAAAEARAERSAALAAAADVCTEVARAGQLADLQPLLGRLADIVDARGAVVWLGTASGADLRPVLVHGYSPQAASRIPPVQRSADNAVAATYRTGAATIVHGSATQTGAILTPMLAPDGCIGALTLEMNGGGESSTQARAIASIFAAQLSGVLAGSVSSTGESAIAASQ